MDGRGWIRIHCRSKKRTNKIAEIKVSAEREAKKAEKEAKKAEKAAKKQYSMRSESLGVARARKFYQKEDD